MRRRIYLAVAAFAAAAVLVPVAAQADPGFYAAPMFGIDPAPGGQLLVADAGQGIVDADTGELVADEKGTVDWVASFPTQGGIQSVPTSVAIGPDGAYYVGELTGFPAPLGLSRVWRVEPGSRHVRCGVSAACAVAVSARTSIIDLAFGPDGKLYVAQLEDTGWPALEGGGGVGGSVHACNVET